MNTWTSAISTRYGRFCHGATTLALAMLTASYPVTGFADNWTSSAELNLRADYVDNILLEDSRATGRAEEEAVETRQTLEIEAHRNSRIFALNLGLEGELVQYSGTDLVENQENGKVDVDLHYSPNRKVVYGLQAGYQKDTRIGRVRSLAELDFGNNDEPVDPGLDNTLEQSFVREQADVDYITARGDITWGISRRANMTIGAEYRDAEFEQLDARTARQFQDYDDYNVDAKLGYTLTNNGDKVFLRVARSEYSPKNEISGSAAEIVRYPVELSYERVFSNLFVLRGMAGFIRSEIDNFDSGSSSGTEPVLRLSINGKSGPHSYFALGATQNVWAGASGILRRSRQAHASYLTKIRPRQEFGIKVLYGESRNLDETTGTNDFEHLTVEPRLIWLMTRKVNLSLRYIYEQRSFEFQGDADAHSVSLDITWDLWGRD